MKKRVLSKTTFLSLFMLILVSTGLSAQNYDLFNYNTTITPTVESFQMTRHGGLQHTLNTGTMSYSIPLYVYKDEDFEIPLSLDYSFDGYRPFVHSGTIGLGWFLNCGGVITRDVHGIPDDTNWGDNWEKGYFYTVQHSEGLKDIVNNKAVRSFGLCNSLCYSNIEVNNDVAQYWYRNEPFHTRYDSDPDIFHFSFMGHHGDFIMLENGEIRVFNSDLPYGTIKVSFSSNGGIEVVESTFIISTGDGYEYTFSSMENTHSSQIYSTTESFFTNGDIVSEPTPNSKLIQGIYADDQFYPNGEDMFSKRKTVTGWRLVSITAPNGNSAEFTYYDSDQHNYGVDLMIQSSYSPGFSYYESPVGNTMGRLTSASGTLNEVRTLVGSNVCPLYSVCVNGKEIIKMTYELKEKMESVATCFGLLNAGILYQEDLPLGTALSNEICLKGIIIKNRDGENLDTIELSHFYTSDANGAPRMFLSGISGLREGSYEFGYNVDNTFQFPLNDANETDYWGYWNGAPIQSLASYIKKDTTTGTDLYDQITGGVKNPNMTYAVKGALTQITYPTGGTTDIVYEQHSAGRLLYRDWNTYPEIIDNEISFQVGGIRVKSLTDRIGETDTAYVKSFNYLENDGTSSGVLMQMPRYWVPVMFHLNSPCAGYLPYPDEEPIQYYSISDRYLYLSVISAESICSLSRDPNVMYSRVREIFPDNSYVEYEFTDWDDYPDVYSPGSQEFINKKLPQSYDIISSPVDSMKTGLSKMIAAPVYDNSDMRGKIKVVSNYQYSGSGYRLVRKTETFYSAIYNSTVHFIYNLLSCFLRQEYYIQTLLPSYTYETDYVDELSGRKLTRRTTYTYNEYGQIRSRKEYDSALQNGNCAYWKYCHERDTSYMMTLVEDAVQTQYDNGSEYLTKSVHATYTDGNPSPSTITTYRINTPICVDNADVFSAGRSGGGRTVNLLYNNLQRLIQANYPGGAYVKYTWDYDGRYILSKEENGTNYKHFFQWKDLVGITDISSPTGETAHYTYDSRNRLSSQRDTEGNPIYHFFYKLKNE